MTQTGGWMHRPRSYWVERLQKDFFDLIIIGGGITGAGIAREASLAGWRVALLEANDFASGTSSRSTKLVHGGLRYLAQGEVRLVRETGKERAVLHKLAPHLVEPMPFLLPIYDGMKHGLTAMSFAVWLYDRLAGVKISERRHVLNAPELKKRHAELKQQGLHGGVLYHEYLTDDARLTLATLQSASEWGAVVLNDCPVEELLYAQNVGGPAEKGSASGVNRGASGTKDHQGAGAAGGAGGGGSGERRASVRAESDSGASEPVRVQGVKALDRATGRSMYVRGHIVINAAGPWIEEVLGMDTGTGVNGAVYAASTADASVDASSATGSATARPTTSPLSPTPKPTPACSRVTHSRGIHLSFSAERLPLPHALALQTPDGRLIFLIPKRDVTYVGTTDRRYDGDLAHPNVPPEDVDYLLELTNEVLPDLHLTKADIIGTWSGVRPLVTQSGTASQKDTKDVSREDEIWISPQGLVTIAGGKLTAFRKMAERVVEKVRPLLLPPVAQTRQMTDRALADWKRRQVLSPSVPLYGAKEIPWKDTESWRSREAKWLTDSYSITAEDSLALIRRYGDCAKAVLVYWDEKKTCQHPPLQRVVPEIPLLEVEIPYMVGVEMARHVADIIGRRTELGRFRGKHLRSLIETVARRMQVLLVWTDEVRDAEVAACLRECHLFE